MSIALPTVDLSSAGIGTKGTISLQNVGLTADPSIYAKKPILQIFNDSGCGLLLTTRNEAHTLYIPAGGWRNINLQPGESNVDYSVIYVLPNPPVSTLMPIYYRPGEEPDPIGTLGNSPVGIGGSVQTSSVQTLSNEGNAANILVIDIGDAALSQLIRFFTDHFILKVDQSGVAHTVLTGSTTGSPAQIGQAGDTSEVLGALKVDQATTLVGNLTAQGTSSLDNGAITTDGTGKITAISQILSWIIGTLTLGQASAGDILDAHTTNQLYVKGGANGAIFMQPKSGSTAWSFDNNGDFTCNTTNGNGINYTSGRIKSLNSALATACGSGTTITHGIGGTPGGLTATPNIAQAGSATVGIGNIGATTFQATVGAGSALSWWGYR